jgi:hypothetical protein
MLAAPLSIDPSQDEPETRTKQDLYMYIGLKVSKNVFLKK